MLFSSISFLYYFLPLVLACYFLIPSRSRNLRNFALLFFSLVFYGCGGPKFLIVMVFSIVANYLFGLAVSTYGGKWRRLLLFMAVGANIGILCYFKYTNFFLSNAFLLLGKEFAPLEIVMPIGISFFTFQGLSYVIDVYRNRNSVQKNPLKVALYISMFPQLVAGPIVRYETVAKQIDQRRESIGDVGEGLRRFCIGLGKKVLIANPMGEAAAAIFGQPIASASTASLWLAMLAFTLQIYFDFSGYSDMAIGLGRVFGFRFLENFNYPYISKSITEFWRRWHISLSSWFRDYVYIPLGGNRVSKGKWIRNIFIVWLLTGFWHGAHWNFIAWGLFYGVLLLIERLWLGERLKRCPATIRHLYTMIFVSLGWVLFNSESLLYSFEYIRGLWGIGTAGIYDSQALYLLIEYKVEFIIALIACFPVSGALRARIATKYSRGGETATTAFASIWCLSLLVLSTIMLINTGFNPFIYFRF